jgi:hypothetical protein
LSNGFYLTIILLISLWVMRREYVREATPAVILLWMFTLYPILAHSLFEVAERHRYGALPFMAILAAMAVSQAGRRAHADFKVAAHGEAISHCHRGDIGGLTARGCQSGAMARPKGNGGRAHLAEIATAPLVRMKGLGWTVCPAG